MRDWGMLRCGRNDKKGASRQQMPPLPQSFNERMAAISPTISESFCIKSQKSALACSSGVSGRGIRTILYSILVSSFLPGRYPRRVSAHGFPPCLNESRSERSITHN